MAQQIVLASNNAGKLKEFNCIFSKCNIGVISLGQFNVPDAAETGLSFIENAILKARHGCEYTHLPCMADDSGLEVPALGGQPGIYSARFAGDNATDEENITRLLRMIEDLPVSRRQARFRCIIAYMRNAADPSPIIAEGTLEGIITDQRCGVNGFGYDPVFYLPELKKTCAELSPAEKNRLSHRAKAANSLIKKLMVNKVVNP